MTTGEDTEGMLAKVRKLLAKAESTATAPDEAEAYNAKAAELIAAYGIERAKLALDEPHTDQLERRTVTLELPYALDKLYLLASVAEPLQVQPVYVTRKGAKISYLFGYSSDLDRVQMLYDSLVIQAMRGLPRTLPPREGSSLAAYRRSWLAGFARAIRTRLAEAERAAREEHEQAANSTSLSLALADRVQHVVAMSVRHFPDQVPAGARFLSGRGGPQGYRAGERADLGGSRITYGRASLPQGPGN